MSTLSKSSTPSSSSAQGGSCPIHALVQWRASRSLPSRLGVLLFGLLAYLAFFATVLYAIGFTTGLAVPKDINAGALTPVPQAVLVNASMLLLFVLQHTVMARPRFKAWVTRFIPHAMERSMFVMLASLILAATFALWAPMPQVLWSFQHPVLWWGITAMALIGWAVVFGSSFLISHFDLFGLRQVITNAAGRDYRPVRFRMVGLYKIVRHPLMLGFLIAFWFTPHMTVGHLFFAAMTTGYIFFGVAIEERDLVAAFGEQYLAYRRRVPGVLPRLGRIGREPGGDQGRAASRSRRV